MHILTIGKESLFGKPTIVGAFKVQLVNIGRCRCYKVDEDFSFVKNTDVSFFEGHSESAASGLRIFMVHNRIHIGKDRVLWEHFTFKSAALLNLVIVNGESCCQEW